MARFERDSKGVDTYDMNRARQHHEECNAHGDYDEMQNDKRYNAMQTIMIIKQEAKYDKALNMVMA